MFAHLHTHTEYSLLDGLSKIEPLVQRAKSMGQDALAITDHGALYGAIEFYQTAKKHGVKPIIGMEEMRSLFPGHPEAADNSWEIAERVNIDIQFGRTMLPNPGIPDGVTAREFLRQQCEAVSYTHLTLPTKRIV